MASVHFDAAIPNFAIQEHPAEDPPWRYEIFDTEVKMDDEGNALLPDDRPGFGMELNDKAAAKHPYEPRHRSVRYYSDGSVAET
jgi:L-alanine-DL-glutamate epimerase-like enolase superfamily enzyme